MATLSEMRAAMPPGWEQGITFEGILEALDEDLEARDIVPHVSYICGDNPQSYSNAAIGTLVVDAVITHYYDILVVNGDE